MGRAKKFSCNLCFLTLIFCAILFHGSISFSSDQESSYRPPDSWEIPFILKVGVVRDAQQGKHVYIPIIKDAGSEEIRGFDLLLAYDARALSFMGATANPKIYDRPGDYEWEYFTYRFGALGNDSLGPSGTLRIVSIADQNNGGHHPKRCTIEDNTVFFTLDFFVSDDRNLECQFTPVRFYWADCGDNTIAFSFRDEGQYEIKMGISEHVFDFEGSDLTDTSRTFRTFCGAPDTCLSKQGNKAIRWIDFYNGGIDIYCDEYEFDPTGDVNSNGIAYEIGDLVVFFNYFLVGLAAFTINEEEEIAATDINKDGVPLTVQDYQQLANRINGEAISNSTIFSELKIMITDSTFRIDYSSRIPVSVIWFWFYAPDRAIDWPDEVAYSTYWGDTIKPIAPSRGHTLDSSVMEFKYYGTPPTLVYCEAAGINGENIKFKIINEVLPKNFVLHQNHPNPFNSSTAITFDLPTLANWSLDIINANGQKIRTFLDENIGSLTILWDGKDENGMDSPSGVYLYRLRAGAFSESKKMLLLK